MSEEPAKDVSPLRLKRPVSPAPSPGGEGLPPATIPPTPPPATIPPTVPPLFLDPDATIPPGAPSFPPPASPLATVPEGIDGSATIPPTPPSHRRRPSLASDSAGAPGASPLPSGPEPEHEVITPVKLRVGAKPPAPPSGVGAGLPDDLFPAMQGTPLMPLPGLPPLAPLPGMPPAGTPPPPHLPGARPPGTAVIGSGPLPGGSPYKLAGADDALRPLTSPGSTRPPMPISAGTRATTSPLPQRKAAKAAPARRDLLVFLLIFLLLAALGGGAYFYLTRPEASAEALAGMKQKFEKAAELPGKAVESAKESIAGARGAEQARADNVMDGKEPPDKRAIGALSPAELEAKLKDDNSSKGQKTPDATVPAKLSPPANLPKNEVYSGIGNGASTVATPAASAKFTRYAEGLSVSGVFQGSPARALVDGRLIRAGDLIEPSLGVSFLGVDAETKHLILQDASGAQVRVKY